MHAHRATRFTAPLAAALWLVATSVAAAAAPDRGELLYENHCRGCHESVVHVREHRKEHERAGVTRQVQRWQEVLGLGWSTEDVRDVADYLYRTYYHAGVSTRQ